MEKVGFIVKYYFHDQNRDKMESLNEFKRIFNEIIFGIRFDFEPKACFKNPPIPKVADI